VTTRLADNFRFLKALITNPKTVGAVIPSSPSLARAMARQIDPAAGPVLEVGPGTGVISEAILERGVAPSALTLVEYDEELARHLAARFPQVQVIQGDAFDLDHTLRSHGDVPFGAIISSLPLLNHPMARRQAYMEDITRRLAPGAPLIQFSYGAHAPVVPPPGFVVVRTAQVWANIPPAKVWVYRRA
jgi:phosphatidylethanolamine/phosphatidyl-N-methylethanolamine N-methyltransferase